MLSKYRQNSANCVRLAGETNEPVLSFGYMKMAEAWLDLDKRRQTKARSRRHIGSRQVNRRVRQGSKSALKTTKRRIQASSH